MHSSQSVTMVRPAFPLSSIRNFSIAARIRVFAVPNGIFSNSAICFRSCRRSRPSRPPAPVPSAAVRCFAAAPPDVLAGHRPALRRVHHHAEHVVSSAGSTGYRPSGADHVDGQVVRDRGQPRRTEPRRASNTAACFHARSKVCCATSSASTGRRARRPRHRTPFVETCARTRPRSRRHQWRARPAAFRPLVARSVSRSWPHQWVRPSCPNGLTCGASLPCASCSDRCQLRHTA